MWNTKNLFLDEMITVIRWNEVQGSALGDLIVS